MNFIDDERNDVTLDTPEGMYFRKHLDGRPEWSIILIGTGPMNTPISDILAAFSKNVGRSDLEIVGTSTLGLALQGCPQRSAARAIELHHAKGFFQIMVRPKLPEGPA